MFIISITIGPENNIHVTYAVFNRRIICSATQTTSISDINRIQYIYGTFYCQILYI